MILHPEYFPSTATWEVDGFKASTLAELMAIMRDVHPGVAVRFVGYHPEGVTFDWGNVITEERAAADKRATMLARTAVKTEPSRRQLPTPGRKGPGRKCKYDHDAVLNMWQAGASTSEIMDRMACSKAAVSGILSNGRVRNDPRAVRRWRSAMLKSTLAPESLPA